MLCHAVLNECIDLPITSWTHVDFNVLSALLAVGGTRCIVNISKQLQLDPLSCQADFF